jgi:hypothetical protein
VNNRQSKDNTYALTLGIVSVFALFQCSCSPVQTETDKQKNTSAVKAVVGAEAQKERAIPPSVASSRCPIIRQVTLLPEQPTILDNIRAVLSLDRDAPADIKYEYKWYINDKPVVYESGNILPSGLFRKKDRVSVEVTPSLATEKGFTCQSYFRVIHSAPPSLSLRDETTKVGEIIELQLVGVDPDGDKITYALEDPRLEGMIVDKMSGKVSWKPVTWQKGVYRFRASASDSDGSKTTKTFEFSLDTK